MLDQETKRKIDNARDILVGKVPDPKSQVEQITIALIYKFMDDMDKDSESLGGKATFFTGEFEKYAWPKIVDTKIGGQERLNLYAEAITQMNHNKNIPQLFRDIFKNAFLPYRDPETLNMFLKEINGFHYDHSENLGDAYEYLLSIMSSQGDAGQFRTPRHIIDLMVNVIEPKKHETGLDPACGTAGFLISFYNYILRENSKERKGDQLTPDERKRLMGNLAGYDISPDMVRISLVNMYLHGFSNPMIYEYDTLTSEDRWQETSDIILANPPFMSPKGGIRPHKRFSIKANRSEVLFVDYIAEHMATNGRAGVIVPEGIIFQSATAYKALRKMLVDGGYLYAVVSLPAGVFNPYSGVKTSILFMDKVLAKRTQDILFVKVENDGFDLGAQRKPIDKDDLPRALDILLKYKRALREGKEVEFTEEEKQIAHAVPKAKIGEKGEYSLSGDRYKEAVISRHRDWPTAELGDVCEKITDGSHNPPKASVGGGYWMLSSQNIKNHHLTFDNAREINYEDFLIEDKRTGIREGDVLLTIVGTIGRSLIVGVNFPKFVLQRSVAVLRPKSTQLNSGFLHHILQSSVLQKYLTNESIGVAQKGIYLNQLYSIKFPLPPLSVQQEIVAEIEDYQKIIDGAKQIVDNWKPKIQIDEKWPMVALGEITKFIDYRGKTPTKTNGGVPLITAKNVRKGFISEEPREYIDEANYDEWMSRGLPKIGDVLFTTEAPLGNVAQIHTDSRIALAQRIIALQVDEKHLLPSFLKYVLLCDDVQRSIQGHATGSTASGIKASTLREIMIPVPPLEIQQQIVAQIDEEQKIVEANKKLIEIFEGKIKTKIAEVWG